MTASSSNAPCPRCGQPAPGRSADGLCPACLLAAVAAPTEPGLDTGPAANEAQPPGERAPRPRPAPPSVEAVAAAFPHLEILGLIGQGGMGCVFKARQPQLNRAVALKILPESLAADPAFANRFTREAQALAALSHPNIVTIHDFGQAGPFYFLLMEFVDGVNLRQLLLSRRLSPEEALAIVPPLCDALQFAHDRGIVHRDIKPENLLLDRAGRIKVADFGIARMLESGPERPAGEDASAPPHLDGTGGAPTEAPARTIIAGTPGYMAPEQATSPERVDQRADIYALGAVLYEMLTGELPGTRLQPPSRKVQIDIRLDAIVLRALEHTPELRFPTAAEFRTQIETLAGAQRQADGSDVLHTTATIENPGGATATTTAPSGSPPPARLLKASTGLWTSRERLATAVGQLFHYRDRGQLILDERQLAFSRNGQHTIVPLQAIRSLSLGRYPRAMNPLGPSLLSITYIEGARERQVFVTPIDGFFALPSTWNDRVLDWHRAIRAAVKEATGRAPAESTAHRAGVPPSAPMVGAFILGSIIVSLGVNALLFRPSTHLSSALRWGPVLFVTGTFLFTWLTIVAIGLWRTRRAAPPTARPGVSRRAVAAWLTGLIAALALLGTGITLTFRHIQELQPRLERLAWTPVTREGAAILIDIHTTVAGSAVELRANFHGPSLDDWPGMPLPARLGAEAFTASGGRPAAVLHSGHSAGNQAWNIIPPGARTWRVAFVFQSETAAIETFRGLAPADLGPVPLIEGQEIELFHTITSDGRPHVARLGISKPLTAGNPDWMAVSAQISRSDDTMRIHWDITAARAGLVELHVNSHVHPVRLVRREGSRLYHADVKVGLTRIGPQRTRVSCSAGKVGTSQDLEVSYDGLAATAAGAATLSAKSRRPEVVDLLAVTDFRVFFRVTDPDTTAAAEAPNEATEPAAAPSPR